MILNMMMMMLMIVIVGGTLVIMMFSLSDDKGRDISNINNYNHESLS